MAGHEQSIGILEANCTHFAYPFPEALDFEAGSLLSVHILPTHVHIPEHSPWAQRRRCSAVAAVISQEFCPNRLFLALQYPGEPWYIIGHSMGAAMATLCALDLRFTLQPQSDVRVYTFGSPRVGNDVFATFFGSVIEVRQYLVLLN